MVQDTKELVKNRGREGRALVQPSVRVRWCERQGRKGQALKFSREAGLFRTGLISSRPGPLCNC